VDVVGREAIMQVFHYVPTRTGWNYYRMFQSGEKKVAEITRKRGRRCYSSFLDAPAAEMLTVEIYEANISRSATAADTLAVRWHVYKLNRQALLDLQAA
jgi:hypothetical protein